MENNEHKSPDFGTVNKSGGSGRRNAIFFRIAVLVLSVLVILLGFLWITSRQTLQEVTLEREQSLALNKELQLELDSVLTEYYHVKMEYDSVLHEQDSIIQANAREIQSLLARQADYHRIRRQLDLLRDITQSYVKEIDSLHTLNEVLRAENIQMREEIRLEQRRTTELTQDKAVLETKVEVASELRAYQVNAFPFRLRGRGRESETDRSGRVEQVRVCFLVGENPIAPAGEYNLYMRIADPNGNILRVSDDLAHSFTHGGDTLQYSVKDSFNYQNQRLNKCVTWHRIEEFLPGKHEVTLYTDNFYLGSTSFELR